MEKDSFSYFILSIVNSRSDYLRDFSFFVGRVGFGINNEIGIFLFFCRAGAVITKNRDYFFFCRASGSGVIEKKR